MSAKLYQVHLPSHLFDNIKWSTDMVLKGTITRCAALVLRDFLLPALSDIDEEKDLRSTDIVNQL